MHVHSPVWLQYTICTFTLTLTLTFTLTHAILLVRLPAYHHLIHPYTPAPPSLLPSLQGKWIYGEDPIEALRFEAPLVEFKSQIAEPDGIRNVFCPLIRKYLLDNPHKVTVELQVGAGSRA